MSTLHRCLFTLALATPLSASAAPDAWTHLAFDQSRIARVAAEPVDISTPTWIAHFDSSTAPIAFTGPSSPVIWGRCVIALGRSAGIDRIYCFDRSTGATLWQHDLAPSQNESWSSPAIDTLRGTVIAPSGNQLAAFDILDGTLRWATTFSLPLVNVSPLVTTDRGAEDRCFVTDFSGFGIGASLHCINVSPFDAALNPYQPGAVVWSTSLNGRGGSGNSCAYANDTVYVASAGRFSPPLAGQVMAFDASAPTAPLPLWITTNPVNEGFYGGVSIENGAVYAASYAFFAGLDSATALRINAQNGAIEWCSPANRTASIPIPFSRANQSFIAISTGLPGASFGSRPALELFNPTGSATCTDHLLWETSSATWIDNGNAVIEDGEFNIFGGWTHHPVIIETSSGNTLMYIGAIASSGATADQPYTSLYLVDLAALPTPGNVSGFAVQQFVGCGSSPALAGANLYSIGAAGLHAFGPSPSSLDVNGDAIGTTEDLYTWETGAGAGGRLDIDRSLAVDNADRDELRTGLRVNESVDMNS